MLSRLKIAVRINLLLALAAFGMLVCAGIGLRALRAHMLEDKRVQLTYLMDLVLHEARDRMSGVGGAPDRARPSRLYRRDREAGHSATAPPIISLFSIMTASPSCIPTPPDRERTKPTSSSRMA